MPSQTPPSEFSKNTNNIDNASTNTTNAIDCVEKIIEASNLERAGKVSEAIALYKEVIKIDTEGTYRKSAEKALEAIEGTGMSIGVTEIGNNALSAITSEVHHPQAAKSQNWLDWTHKLSIRRKQLLALLSSEAVSILFLMLIPFILIVNNGRTQLKSQADSELEVADINYQIKIDQMGFGFRGQSDNAAIIEAAQIASSGETVPAELREQVKEILKNEIQARNIEYATLVGTDRKIIVNANADRTGEEFDPDGLVSKILRGSQEQIKTSAIVQATDLKAENPPLPQGFKIGQDGLIRYTITPVKARNSEEIIGVLVSGDLVNNKLPIVDNTLEAFDGGYAAVYYYNSQNDSQNQFIIATSKEGEEGKAIYNLGNEQLPANYLDLLSRAIANPQEVQTARINLNNGWCLWLPLPGAPKCYTVAAQAITDSDDLPVGVLVRGTSETALNSSLGWALIVQLAFVVLALAIDFGIAKILEKVVADRIEQLKRVTQNFTKGDRTARAEVIGTDEVSQLNMTFNQMADSIVHSEKQLIKSTELKKKEIEIQRREKEKLQEEVIKLLLEIERARDGDLTVQGKVTDGVVGSIADAINATIDRIRQLVLEVQTVAEQVNYKSQTGENSVQELNKDVFNQAMEINEALERVAQIDESIQRVAYSAREAAEIARQALAEAQEGDTIMEQTVDNIEAIRGTVASNVKKVKQLAESSQEISQIVEIISNISEKTNLLAFNASIEAARAGEHGEGFRTVADEVRRLADRVTQSTKDIQQLVATIQRETGVVVQSMESSNSEVLLGTELVRQTQNNLKNIATTSEKIDQFLQSISKDTADQTYASHEVNSKISEIASIAESTSTEAEKVLESLQSLVEESRNLQSSISRFNLKA
ncbi:MAG: methyl-accepting chemotaxis protein [Prochloraceae cyanobacterium]|nr:methyl-accepting chemotaxis protein [Prochloraceae cyanobacterium]